MSERFIEDHEPQNEEGQYRSAEVEAFMERFNYFRKPYNERNQTDTSWVRKHRFAGDRIVQDALDGKADIGLLLNKVTTFICFDIDPKKEIGDAGIGETDDNGGDHDDSDGDRGEAEAERAGNGNTDNGEDLLKVDKGDGGSASAEGQERPVVAELQNDEREGHEGDGESSVDTAKDWPGWKELGIDGDDEGLRAAMAAIVPVVIPAVELIKHERFKRELGPELKASVGVLLEYFNGEPSLVVKSPHGCHVYWCLETREPWFRVRPMMVKVRRAWLREARARGIADIGVEVLPSIRKPLRVPRKDRLIKTRSLEPMEKPEDGEAFWRGLRMYPFEGLIKEEVLNRKAGNAKGPGPRQPSKDSGAREDEDTAGLAVDGVEGGKQAKDDLARTRAKVEVVGSVGTTQAEITLGDIAGGTVGTGSEGAGADENASDGAAEKDNAEEKDILGLRPKNRKEAEGMLMPFANSRTNPQLIKMIEGGKREGLSLELVSAWILSWEGRSRDAGYVGDIFDNRDTLRARIAAIYAASTATAAGATRFVELWNRKKDEYARDDEAAERALERLETVSKQPKQSRQAVLRFFADIDAWRRAIDDAAADKESELDATTRRNRARGVYPLPYALLRVMYSGCDRVWKDVQAAGIVAKAEGNGGQYVPNIGRPQYYSLNI